MIRRTAPLAVLCALVLALPACAGTDEPGDEPQAAPTASTPTASTPATGSPGRSPEPAQDGTVIELTYADGEVSGDTDRVEVPLGGTVVLRVTSDVAEQIHVHGVDEYVDVPAGQPTEATFVADVPGVFEVELHRAGTLLTRLQVQ
jgi:hypothetical protein